MAAAARIAYAGENGRPYTAIGRILIDERRAGPRPGLAGKHPRLAEGQSRPGARRDGSRPILRLLSGSAAGRSGLGSPGAGRVPLTPLASMAIDLRLNVLGAPYYVAAADPVHALLIAQDTGGAIRGAVRGDIFFGFGQKAEADAGGMKAQGRLYVLLPECGGGTAGRKGLTS